MTDLYLESRTVDGTEMSITKLNETQQEIWKKALDTEDLDQLFDSASATDAIAVLDNALAFILQDPESIRQIVWKNSDWRGVRGNRRVIEGVRNWLADHPGSTISGLLAEEELEAP